LRRLSEAKRNRKRFPLAVRLSRLRVKRPGDELDLPVDIAAIAEVIPIEVQEAVVREFARLPARRDDECASVYVRCAVCAAQALHIDPFRNLASIYEDDIEIAIRGREHDRIPVASLILIRSDAAGTKQEQRDGQQT
jgi:hypothetical protein